MPIPDDCPERNGDDCQVVEHAMERRNHRRSSDRLPASATRIIMALIGVIGAGSGGYIFRDKVMAAPPAVEAHIDGQARQQIELLKVEIRGELGLIRQQQEQTNERLKELLEKAERAERYRRRGTVEP